MLGISDDIPSGGPALFSEEERRALFPGTIHGGHLCVIEVFRDPLLMEWITCLSLVYWCCPKRSIFFHIMLLHGSGCHFLQDAEDMDAASLPARAGSLLPGFVRELPRYGLFDGRSYSRPVK